MSLRLRIAEHTNPILIKEVRQAVRGRFFRVCFLLTLAVALFAAISMMPMLSERPHQRTENGPQFFFVFHLIFMGAAFLMVPMQANRSMASERDDKTFDALITSGLKPAQIILGKWLSSGMLLLLFLSAFAPFLAISFTLFGLDVLVSAVFLAFTLSISMSLNLAGIFAACVGKSRAFQTMLLALLALCGLLSLAIWGTVNASALFESSGAFFWIFGVEDFLLPAGLTLLALGILNYWLYGACIATITHREENGLLRMRWACLLMSVVSAITIFMLWTSHVDISITGQHTVMAYVILAFLNVPLLTESDYIGVRCRHQIQSGKWQRPFAWMFLPGGTSAVPLYLLQLGLVSIPLLVAFNASYSRGGLSLPAIGLGLSIALTLFPSSFLVAPRVKPARRVLARILIPMSPILIALLTTLLGVLLRIPEWSNMRTSLNPFYALAVHDSRFSQEHSGGFIMWWLLAIGCVGWRGVSALDRRRKIRQLAASSNASRTPESETAVVQED
ncbi:MAG: ABC transporter permease [Planctomycetota bacterium]